tara:strand:- start:570 stop:881 length:312 start_codon:yes stop_codon:yes gene_type:complete
MNDIPEFEGINSPSEKLDAKIFSKAYPKELADKLNGGIPVVGDFFIVGNSTIMRLNVNDGMHAVYHFEKCPAVLTANQCESKFDSMVEVDAEWVEETEKRRAS